MIFHNKNKRSCLASHTIYLELWIYVFPNTSVFSWNCFAVPKNFGW